MAKLFRRKGSKKHYAECYFHDGTKRRRHIESTGIVDDGTARAKQTAQIVADRIERDLAARGAPPKKASKTLRQAVDALNQAQELGMRARGTINKTLDQAANLLDYFGEQRALDTIDMVAVREYAIDARSSRAAITVKGELVVLGAAFRAVDALPPKFPDLGDVTPKPQRVLEVHEQQALFLGVPPERKLSLMAYLQLGLRHSELWKIESIDWDKRYAHVAGTKTRGSNREVPIPSELFELLLPHRENWRECFPKWCRSAVNETLTNCARRAEFIGEDEKLSTNDTRGTYATMMARSGVSPLILAAIMGNSPKQLEKTYAQVRIRGDHHHEAVARGVPRLTTPAKPKAKQA